MSDLRVGSVFTNDNQPTPADAPPQGRDDVPVAPTAAKATPKPKLKPLLTSKEMKVMELLSYGYENRDIAKHFQTTAQAVKNMLRTINLKLGADNRTHAVAICFRNGWLPVAEISQSPPAAGHPICGDVPCCTSRYALRRYDDGTVDSFCTECGMVIARARRFADLFAADNNHVCQPTARRHPHHFGQHRQTTPRG